MMGVTLTSSKIPNLVFVLLHAGSYLGDTHVIFFSLLLVLTAPLLHTSVFLC